MAFAKDKQVSQEAEIHGRDDNIRYQKILIDSCCFFLDFAVNYSEKNHLIKDFEAYSLGGSQCFTAALGSY